MDSSLPGFVRCLCADCAPKRRLFIAARLHLLESIDRHINVTQQLLDATMIKIPLAPNPTSTTTDKAAFRRYIAECGAENKVPISGMLEDVAVPWPVCVADVNSSQVYRACIDAVDAFEKATQDITTSGQLAAAARPLMRVIEANVPRCSHRSAAAGVVEAIHWLRDRCVTHELPDMFNEYLKSLKRRICHGELVIDVRTMWITVQTSLIRLIEKGDVDGQCQTGGVTATEAIAFTYDLNFISIDEQPRPAIRFFVAEMASKANSVETSHSDLPLRIVFLEEDINDLIKDPGSWQLVLLMLKGLRSYAVDNQIPDAYNEVLRGVKHQVLLGKGTRNNLWREVQFHHLGLVEGGAVTKDEATEFLYWSLM